MILVFNPLFKINNYYFQMTLLAYIGKLKLILINMVY